MLFQHNKKPGLKPGFLLALFGTVACLFFHANFPPHYGQRSANQQPGDDHRGDA
jgi:hypothetical protein